MFKHTSQSKLVISQPKQIQVESTVFLQKVLCLNPAAADVRVVLITD